MKLVFILILSLSWASIASAAEILFSERRDDRSFKRISEYLGGKENPGRYVIARTDPSQRDGYYVALKLDAAELAKNVASIRIHSVQPGSQDIDTTDLPIEAITKNRVLVGFTDGEWATTEKIPTAWRIEFLDTTGAALFHSQSFLWEATPR